MAKLASGSGCESLVRCFVALKEDTPVGMSLNEYHAVAVAFRCWQISEIIKYEPIYYDCTSGYRQLTDCRVILLLLLQGRSAGLRSMLAVRLFDISGYPLMSMKHIMKDEAKVYNAYSPACLSISVYQYFLCLSCRLIIACRTAQFGEAWSHVQKMVERFGSETRHFSP